MTPKQWMKRVKVMEKKRKRDERARMKKPLTVTRWVTKYPTGTFSSLLYEEKELKRLRCMEKCDPNPYGKLVKVLVKEIK